MTRALAILCLASAIAPAAFAKDKPKAAPAAAPPVAASTGIYYPVPPDVAEQLRARQYENDQLEIENQRMQVKIEQNRQRQQELGFEMQGIAFDYATAKHIDLNLFQLDMRNEVKFVERKKAP